MLGFVTAAEGDGAGSEWRARFCGSARATAARPQSRSAAARARLGQRRAARGARLALPRARRGAEQLVALDGAERRCRTWRCASSCAAASTRSARSRPRAGQPFGVDGAALLPALVALEQQGSAMRGSFTAGASGRPAEEWCERRLLARIHRYTLKRLRSEIEPATIADYQRFLLHWQGLGGERREGREALSAVLGELQGLALPAARRGSGRCCRRAWQTTDRICWINCPRPASSSGGGRGRAAPRRRAARAPSQLRRSRSCRARRSAMWRALERHRSELPQALSGAAERVARALRGARRVVFPRARTGQRAAARASGGGPRRARRAGTRHG